MCAGGAVVSPASADEWPLERQFGLVEPPPIVHGHPPPSSVAEDVHGALLVLVYWPLVETTKFGEQEFGHTSLVRISSDGSRAFVPPFGKPDRDSFDDQVDDDILPLPDGSILFTRRASLYRLRPHGSIVRVAGTGRYAQDGSPSGDGDPATATDIATPHGLSRFPDGSIVFAEGNRIRRIASDGAMTTIAGTGVWGYSGDGGAATDAQLAAPSDVLPTRNGGFFIADTFNLRVRRVSADGVISTVAGAAYDPLTSAGVFENTGDGGPATAAHLALPAHLARLPDGSLVIGEDQDIRRVAPDGTISTIFHAEQTYGDRVGDFAGRYGTYIEAMDVTREGGIAVVVSGSRLRALYLAPRRTRRTLVALRGARVSGRHVTMTVDATTRGLLQLKVRRRGRLVALASRRVRSGRSTIGVGGRFSATDHRVTVTLRADRGGGYGDHIDLFTSETLPKRFVPIVDNRCQRIGRRRIDCELHEEEAEESGVPCLNTLTYRLFRSGLLFARPYGPACHHEPLRFDRTPDWTGPWRASLPR
jgi:hypothetical protein